MNYQLQILLLLLVTEIVAMDYFFCVNINTRKRYCLFLLASLTNYVVDSLWRSISILVIVDIQFYLVSNISIYYLI